MGNNVKVMLLTDKTKNFSYKRLGVQWFSYFQVLISYKADTFITLIL